MSEEPVVLMPVRLAESWTGVFRHATESEIDRLHEYRKVPWPCLHEYRKVPWPCLHEHIASLCDIREWCSAGVANSGAVDDTR